MRLVPASECSGAGYLSILERLREMNQLKGLNSSSVGRGNPLREETKQQKIALTFLCGGYQKETACFWE